MPSFEISSSIKIVTGVIVAIVAVAGIARQIWRAKNRYQLKWVLLETESLLNVAEEIAPEISITLRNETIKDVTKYRFVLHNSGLSPIDGSDIVENLQWQGSGKILSAKVIATNPPVKLQLSREGNILEISWKLFNQSCMALIEILCEASIKDSSGKISGEIRNIPIIEEKEVPSPSLFTLPKLIEPNFRPYIMVRKIIQLLSLYAAVTPTIISIAFTTDGTAPVWTIPIGLFLSALIIWVIFKLGRNPYAKLIAIAKREDTSTK